MFFPSIFPAQPNASPRPKITFPQVATEPLQDAVDWTSLWNPPNLIAPWEGISPDTRIAQKGPESQKPDDVPLLMKNCWWNKPLLNQSHLETLQKPLKKYSLLRLPWILVAKMLATIGFSVGFHLYPWWPVDQTSRGSLDLGWPMEVPDSCWTFGVFTRLTLAVLTSGRVRSEVFWQDCLVILDSLQVVITYSLPWFTVTRAAHSHVRNTVRLKLQKIRLFLSSWDGRTWQVLFSSEG